MKKGVQLSALFIITLLSITSVLAVDITLSKEDYQPEELFQAEITGNFISLNKDNLFIYLEDKVHPAPIIKGITRQDNIYYFYAILPKQPGNYSLRIQDTGYIDRGKIISTPVSKKFVINFKNTSDLYINPGFIIPKEDFSIDVKSLYKNPTITATFEATGESKTIELLEGEKTELKFSLPELPPQKLILTIGNYNIPIFLVKKFDQPIFKKLEFLPFKLEGKVLENEVYSFNVLLKNNGNQEITNITLSSNLDLTLNPEKINLIKPNNSILLNITINVPEVEGDFYEGNIDAEFEGNKMNLPINLEITKNEEEVFIEETIGSSESLNCGFIGAICSEKEICDADSIGSLDGPCCTGECVVEKKGGISTWIGILIFIIIIGIVGYFIYRIRKKKNIKTPEELLKEKTKRFSRRMQKPSKEVSGNLDKV